LKLKGRKTIVGPFSFFLNDDGVVNCKDEERFWHIMRRKDW
jgi:hypothetical protein